MYLQAVTPANVNNVVPTWVHLFHPTRHQWRNRWCEADLLASEGTICFAEGQLEAEPRVQQGFPMISLGIWEKSGSFWAPAISLSTSFNILQRPSTSFNTLQYPSTLCGTTSLNKLKDLHIESHWFGFTYNQMCDSYPATLWTSNWVLNLCNLLLAKLILWVSLQFTIIHIHCLSSSMSEKSSIIGFELTINHQASSIIINHHQSSSIIINHQS